MASSINKPKKPKSKRTPVRLRHKIEKASAAKQRKQRKQAKKNPEWRSKIKKDPGIPNLFPYKEKLLAQIEQTRQRKADEAQRRRELAKGGVAKEVEEEEDVDLDLDDVEDDIEEQDDDDDMDVEDDGAANPMAALVASARKAAKDYRSRRGGKGKGEGEGDEEEDDDEDDLDSDDDNDDDDDDTHPHVIDVPGAATSRKAFDKVFKAVVEQADVVLYVLDARDPEGTRSRDVERAVLAGASQGKRLVLVLNKVDLVPPPVLQKWLAYLRAQFPTLPLRAAAAAPNAATFHHRDLTPASTGAALFRALKAYAAARNLKRAVSVGVIGYPNVGKSSVINALLSRVGGTRGSSNAGAGAGACPTGAQAGVTTAIRAVKMDKKLTLLDSPGIVFPSEATTATTAHSKSKSDVHAHLVLLNAIPPQQIEDPVPAVTLLLRRFSADATGDRLQQLAAVYDLPPLLGSGGGAGGGDTTTDFLVQVARKRGRLGRGGVPNLHAAAMTVLTDWRDGRIQGWQEAPAPGLQAGTTLSAAVTTTTLAATSAPTTAPPLMADQKQIVTEWAKEFKLDGLWGNDVEDEAMAE